MWAVWRVLHLPEISIRTIDQQIHGIVLNKKVYTFLSPHYVLKRVRRKMKGNGLYLQDTFKKKMFFSAASLSSSHHPDVGRAERRPREGKGLATAMVP